MGRPLVAVLHGVNFDVLELRDPATYGGLTLGELERQIEAFAAELDLAVSCFQTNSEASYVTELHRIARARGRGGPQGLILNPGAWTLYA